VPLFDFLFGPKKPKNCDVVPDKIWLTSDAKFAGIARDIAKRTNKNAAAILLVAHFPDVLPRLDEIAADSTAIPTKAALASNLTPDIVAGLQLDPSTTIDIVAAERHPLASVDERLEAFAASLPCRTRLARHLSLDDPLLQAFSGGWVGQILNNLGMEENECIESTMVSRRIRQAQQKIEAKALDIRPAESAAAWMEKNCPNL
jgi:preprotein translocase subunit SecA